VIEVGDGVVEVLSTHGDTHLGGADWDARLVDHVITQFQKQEGMDLRSDKMAMQRVKEAAEKAKIELSSTVSTDINLPYITADASGPKHLQITITRAQFEHMTEDLVARLITPCKVALADAGISTTDIQDVILVGGTTRMPSVQSAVKTFFGREPNRSVNPDEAVALGAAVQAGVLAGDVTDVLLLDVTPLSLGLETLGGVFTKLIEKNTTIPVKKEQVFSTAQDNQSAVTIRVYQGERAMAVDNKSLGQFDLTGIAPAPRGTPQILVSFNIDSNGLVEVSAKDEATGKSHAIQIKADGGLSADEIEAMVKSAEQNAESDARRRELVEVRNQADALVLSTQKQLKDHEDKIPEDLRAEVSQAVSDLQNVMAEEDVSQIRDLTTELMNKVMKIGELIYKTEEQPPNSSAA
jgi:molecular chaperone DnaK